MKDSEACRKVAAYIAAGKNRRDSYFGRFSYTLGACEVLDYYEKYSLSDEFNQLFVAGEFFLAHNIMPMDEAQEWRILALCLMAAIAESEGR